MGIQTKQSCADCSHANVCPNRAKFEALQKYTDLLVKTPAINSDGVVRTAVRVRVEYRYSNGPALEDIYKNIGIDGWGQVPCGAPGHRVCPLMKRFPFDNPIYAPFPHVVDTVTDHICRSSHDAIGRKIPYYMETIHEGRLGNCHVSQYSGKNWWSCKSCKMQGTPDPSFDYAQLGGSIYSVFYTDIIEGDIGSTIKLKDLPIPKNVSPDYAPSLLANQEEYTLESEEIPIIIYYEYIGLPEPVHSSELPPATPVSSDVRIVNNDRFIYYANSIDTGDIIMVLRSATYNGVKKDYNRVIFNNMASHGDRPTYSIGSFYVGTKLTIDFIIANEDWMPVMAVMRLLMDEPSVQFEERFLSNTRNGTRKAYTMTFTVADREANVIRPAFMPLRLSSSLINLTKYWRYTSENDPGMFWNFGCKVEDMTIPKLFYNATWSEVHKDDSYEGYLPPSLLVYRRFFRLVGFTQAMEDRAHHHNVELIGNHNDTALKWFDFIHWYGNAAAYVKGENTVGAVWELDNDELDRHLRNALAFSQEDQYYHGRRSICEVHLDDDTVFSMNVMPLRMHEIYTPELATLYRDRIRNAIPAGFNAFVVPLEKKTTSSNTPRTGIIMQTEHTYNIYPVHDGAFNPKVKDIFAPDESGNEHSVERYLTPLKDWNPAVTDLLNYERIILVLVPNSDQQMGFVPTTPNFFYMEIFLDWVTHPTTVTFYQHGSTLETDKGLKHILHPDKIIGHSFENVFPEDAEGLILVTKDGEEDSCFTLGGDKAPFYELMGNVDIALVEDVDIEGYIDGCDTPFDTTHMMIPYKDLANIEIISPPGRSLVRIAATVWSADGLSTHQSTLVRRRDGCEIVERETIEDTDFNVTGLNGNGTYKVQISNVHSKIMLRTYWVATEYVEKSTICERCDGYVSSGDYPYVTWTPTCNNFS